MDECSNKFNQTMTNKELQKEILSKAIFSREFEKDLYNRIKKGLFKYPIYSVHKVLYRDVLKSF